VRQAVGARKQPTLVLRARFGVEYPAGGALQIQLQERGREVMYRFLIVIEKANGNFSAYSPDLPGCVATGKTCKQVARNMYEAIEMHVQGLMEDKLPIQVSLVCRVRSRSCDKASPPARSEVA
jgi:predicted RNase H-like HicB family nuclease